MEKMVEKILDRALEIYTIEKENRREANKENILSAKCELARVAARPSDRWINFVTKATPFLRNSRLIAEVNGENGVEEVISEGYPVIDDEKILESMITSPKSLEECDKPIIYIAPHKSNFDSLLVGGTLYQNNYPFPIFAAGENLFNKKFSNYLLTNLSSFKLKKDQREWTADYFRLMNAYIQANIEEKVPIMLFPEGTRSRSGEFGKFNRGLIKLALDSYLNSKKDLGDLLFVPLGIAYTTIFEDVKFSQNKKGRSAKLNLIKDLANMLRNQGKNYIKIGEPYSLNEFVEENELQGKSGSVISKKILPSLRDKVISTSPVLYSDFVHWEMNELFKQHGGKISQKKLGEYVDETIEQVMNENSELNVIQNETLEESLDRMKKRRFIKKNNGDFDLLNASVMEYYSNKLATSYLE